MAILFQKRKYVSKEIKYIPENSNYDINKMMDNFFDDNSIFPLFSSWVSLYYQVKLD